MYKEFHCRIRKTKKGWGDKLSSSWEKLHRMCCIYTRKYAPLKKFLRNFS